MLAGLCGLCVGTYAVLDRTAPRVLATPMLAARRGGRAVTGLVGAGRHVTRSRYRPDPWRLPEWLVLAAGVVTAVLGVFASRHDLLAAYPPWTAGPILDPAAAAGVAVALAGGLAAPPPVRAAAPGPCPPGWRWPRDRAARRRPDLRRDPPSWTAST